MACTRGNKMDYDNWAAMGNPGWSYKDLLPYFLKMEDANVAVNDSEYRAKGGPLAVSDVRFKTELGNAFVAAAQQAGFPYVDYNGKQQMGVSYMQGTLRNGLRSDAENSYLRPVRHRKNLKIRTEAHVTKILIRPGSKEAYGVEYRKNGIPVIKNLPVGTIMYDHVTFLGAAFLINEPVGCDIFAFDSDEYWECAIRAIPGSLFHQQSTCRMGPTTSKDAVVDARLRVHGMRNLRVADISIFPTPVSGHTVCPAYAIGEKTADMIKEDWTPASNVNDIY
nr:unnamed protein product [Callosobruchus chinensis]